MDTRLIVLLGALVVSFVANAAVLLFVYRAVAKAAAGVDRTTAHANRVLAELRGTLPHAAAASERAVELSRQARESIQEAGDGLDRAENWLRYGLAKVDFQVDRAAADIGDATARVKTAVTEPVLRAGAVFNGVKALLELVLFRNGRKPEEPRSAPERERAG